MLPKLLRAEKDKVVERKNNMSKYNLTDILNEYIGGGRIGTLRISYKDLVDKMDELEKSGKVIVREKGSSADGKVNREFEVIDRDSAVPGGRKQERGFTVYDYKFGFDPGDQDNFTEEYDFSVGGNDLQLAMDLIDGVKAYGIGDFPNLKENIPPSRDDKMIKDLAKADEVIKMIKMMNPDVRQDLLKRIARMGQKMDEVMDVDRKGRKKPESKSNLTKVNEASQEESVATYIQDYYRNPKTGESMISDEIVDEFYKTHPEWEDQADGTKEGMEAVLDNFNEFFEINYGIMFDDSKDIDENLKTHFKRFM